MEEDKVVKETEEETLDLSTEEKETKEEEKKEERTVPLAALQEERRKRQELEARISSLETSNKPSTSDSSNPDLEQAIEKLDPYLRKHGYLTREQLEEEKSAEAYASEMKSLTDKYSGKDGRPAFDAYEVSEYGKKNRIFNLEVAYEQLHKKELTDWSMKQTPDEDAPETEKFGSSGIKETGNTSVLTREALAKKLASQGGKEWWEKNREKVIAAMQKGEIS